MANEDSVLSREQQDDIMKAVAAITRQLKVMVGQPQPHTPSLWVIGTNLAACGHDVVPWELSCSSLGDDTRTSGHSRSVRIKRR
jgi:hypothetical protein